MTLITRIALLVLAVPFVLAHGDDCGDGRFKCVFSLDRERNILTRGLGGTPKTSVFPKEDQKTPLPHPPTLTAPSTGRGTLERVAVLLTSHRTPSLLLNALRAGVGSLVSSSASLPRPDPLSSPLLHPSGLTGMARTRTGMVRIEMARTKTTKTGTARTETTRTRMTSTTGALISRSVNTALATLLFALRVSLLALSPAWSVVITSVSTPLSTSITVVVAPLSVRVRTAMPSLAFGTLGANRALAKVSCHFITPGYGRI